MYTLCGCSHVYAEVRTLPRADEEARFDKETRPGEILCVRAPGLQRATVISVVEEKQWAHDSVVCA